MSLGNKQSQTLIRELFQPSVAVIYPVQLFFGPQLVLRPILRQLSKFVTVLICAAVTFSESSWEDYLHASWCKEYQFQDKTKLCWGIRQYTNAYLQQNVHKLCSHWSSSAQSSCFLFTVRAMFSLTGISMASLLQQTWEVPRALSTNI